MNASEEGRLARDAALPEGSWMRDRMRDTHDLRDTVIGYKGDLLGEASLLGIGEPPVCTPVRSADGLSPMTVS